MLRKVGFLARVEGGGGRADPQEVFSTAIGTVVGSVLQDMQGFQLIMHLIVLPLFFFSSALFLLGDLDALEKRLAQREWRERAEQGGTAETAPGPRRSRAARGGQARTDFAAITDVSKFIMGQVSKVLTPRDLAWVAAGSFGGGSVLATLVNLILSH